MTENNKKEPSKKMSKNSKTLLVMLLIAAIIGAGAYFIINKYFPESKKPEPVVENTNIVATSDAPEESNSLGTPEEKEQIVLFTPEENDEYLNIMPDKSLINDLNDYRIYLTNVNELLIKFSRNMDYSANLTIIMQLDLPKEIKEIVSMFDSYNNMLATESVNNGKVSLFNTNIFEKFLKITKETPAQNEMKKLKTNIENKIWLFAGYMFSSELQEAFLKQ